MGLSLQSNVRLHSNLKNIVIYTLQQTMIIFFFYDIVDRVSLKRTGESDIEGNIGKQRFAELFDNVAVETFGLKIPALSCLTKLPI